jgi:cell wall-associated NlpC family hydrolase
MMMALDPRLHAYRADLADMALEGRVEASRFVPGERCRVMAAIAPVRRAPHADAMLLTQALCGEEAVVFDRTEGWAWVQLAADNYVGWMPVESLGPDSPQPTHKVTALRTFAFARPDIKSPPRAVLPLGARLAVHGEAEDKNARYALIAPEGAVVVQHLATLGSAEADWPAVAERFVGTPYLWGGKTSLGIDCSGLVQVALAAGGTGAPRDSDMQEAALGAALDVSSGMPPLRRGDLVFWKGHVGIMLDSDMLLHANAHHMAVVTEPLRLAAERLEGRGATVTSIRRMAGD